jgi:hypothetical protein
MRKYLVFETRSVYQLQLEPLLGCSWRSSIISCGIAQYLQLGVYNDYNLNHCRVATEGVQYQMEELSICNLECVSSATRTTVGLQLKGYSIRWKNLVLATQSVYQLQLEPLSGCNRRGSTISDWSTQYLQLEVYIDCNSNHCLVATRRGNTISGRSTQYLQMFAYSNCN